MRSTKRVRRVSPGFVRSTERRTMEEEEKKLSIEYVDIDKIRPNEYNPKNMTEKEEKELTESITTFGRVEPLLCNQAKGREGFIIGGHQRFKIYKKMGYKTVPVSWINIPDLEKERELCLRLSKNTGSWDWGLLADYDEEMLMTVGFEEPELEARFNLMDETEEDNYNIERALAEKKEPTAKPGQMWKLGQHILLCGDSTDIKDIRRLLEPAQQADMIFTDPPYNVNYKGTNSEGIKNDNMTEEEFVDFTMKFTEVMKQTLKTGGVFYMCSGWSSYPIFVYAIKAYGMKFANPIIWVKNNTSLGWNDYRYKYEMLLKGVKKPRTKKKTSTPVLYGWNGGKHYFKDTRFESDVWEINKRAGNTMIHPTQKPVLLVNRAISNSSKRGEIVLDLFGGSGVTLISCEKLNRKARINELDPKYCDIIIDRWEQYTGKKSILID